MPALSVIDLAMFVLETKERPFNVGPLAVLSPPKHFRGNFADKLVARISRRPLGARRGPVVASEPKAATKVRPARKVPKRSALAGA